MKKNLFIILILLIGVGLLYFKFGQTDLAKADKVKDANTCYSLRQQTAGSDAPEDVYNLKLNIKDSVATGELSFAPALHDKKTGTFQGPVTKPSKDMEAMRGNLVWNATSAGKTQNEELKIIFGSGTAAIGIGEMIDGENGLLKYKSVPEIVYGLVLAETPCEILN